MAEGVLASPSPDYGKCIDVLNSGLSCFPRSAVLNLLKGRVIQIDPEARTSISESLQCFERVLEVDPRNPDALEEIGHYHYVVCDDNHKAILFFVSAIACGGGINCLLGVARIMFEFGASSGDIESFLVRSGCVSADQVESYARESGIVY